MSYGTKGRNSKAVVEVIDWPVGHFGITKRYIHRVMEETRQQYGARYGRGTHRVILQKRPHDRGTPAPLRMVVLDLRGCA